MDKRQSHHEGVEYIKAPYKGARLLKSPLINKDTAFSLKERADLDLDGLLPPHIEDIEGQLSRCYQAYSRKQDDLEKHIYLRSLQDRNETLFYKLVIEHLTEMMPMIYTPTVGAACQQFSHIYRQPRGLFISYPQMEKIHEILDNSPIEDVKVIVVTDGERILGLGDQGAGGMGIPIGKLSLYTACGGINPANTLPIVLDVGTNNQERRDDPGYIGWRHERISGDEYYKFVDKFVQAIKKKWPDVLFQFEDFAQQHANPLLQKYRDQLCTFNDDIQGTAAVAVSAIIAAVKSAGTDMKDQRVAVFGAGSAGCGISEQLVRAFVKYGLSEEEARKRFYMVDRGGVLDDSMTVLNFQKGLTQSHEELAKWQCDKKGFVGLIDVMRNAKPTILLGVSGVPSQFTKDIVQEMAKHVKRPIIFPMSNPTSRCEALPSDIVRWTDGKALIATGSPFKDVELDGKTYSIAQSNNCYIFPGMGLGILAVGAKRVSDDMFMAATLTLSDHAPALHQAGGALLPDLAQIRDVSKSIAIAVAKQAMEEGLADKISGSELEAAINANMWKPAYRPVKS